MSNVNEQETFTTQPAAPKKKGKGLISIICGVAVIALIRFGIPYIQETVKDKKLDMPREELEALVSVQDLVTVNYEITKGDTKEVATIGDLLCAEIRNNSQATITKVEIAYAMWDDAGNPVYLHWADGKTEADNIGCIKIDNLNMAPGETCGADIGLGLHISNDKVSRFLAIPYYYEDINGNKWNNPYYDHWVKQYENVSGMSYLPDLKAVVAEDVMLEELKKQPVVVTATNMEKWSEGDLLCAVVQNNSEATLSKIEIAYAAWDAEGNPVKIIRSNGQENESNIGWAAMKDIALAPGESYGADNGLGLHADCSTVSSFYAIVYSYTDADGNVWENPLYNDWLAHYEKA